MACDLCQKRGRPPEFVLQPSCAFDEDGQFMNINWNCATMNLLRSIAEQVDGYTHRDDLGPCSLSVAKLEYGYVVMSYYKNRGSVSAAMWMCDDTCRLLDISQLKYDPKFAKLSEQHLEKL